jgi:hypothetical protein
MYASQEVCVHQRQQACVQPSSIRFLVPTCLFAHAQAHVYMGAITELASSKHATAYLIQAQACSAPTHPLAPGVREARLCCHGPAGIPAEVNDPALTEYLVRDSLAVRASLSPSGLWYRVICPCTSHALIKCNRPGTACCLTI